MAHSRITKLVAATVVVSAIAAPGVASSAQEDETFTGVCEMSGVIRHQPPITNAPAPTRFHGRFDGVCSGELTDRRGRTRQVDDVSARYDARGTGALSCPGGVATGKGKLILAGGSQIEFRFTERRAPGLAVVTLDGAAGGAGTVVGTVSEDEDLAELNERCSGSGLRHLRGDARIVSAALSG